MTERDYIIIAATICVALQGCSSRMDKSGHSFQVFDENGITIAETSGSPKYEGELFTYEKELVLDTEQSDETLLFRPTQFIADEFGNLFIMDFGKGTILMFDAEGNYLRTIGRKGQGPGEINRGQIELIDQGIIQVFDTALLRTTRFRTDGSLIDITRLPVDSGMALPSGFLVLPDETHLLFINDMNPADMEMLRRGVVFQTAAGDSLGAVFTPFIQVMKQVNMTRGGYSGSTPMPLLYGPSPIATYHPTQGVILCTSDHPQLDIYDLRGRLVRVIRIALNPESVTEADKEEAKRLLLQSASPSNEDAREAERMFAEIPYSQMKAFWSDVEVDDHGFFWLPQSLTSMVILGANYSFRLLSPEGEYLGMTTRPIGSSSISSNAIVSQGRLLVLEEDPESGEILPVIYRITPAVRGLRYPN